MFRRKKALRSQSACDASLAAAVKGLAERAGGDAAAITLFPRSVSAPVIRSGVIIPGGRGRRPTVKGIMKIATADDSLHSVYGNSSPIGTGAETKEHDSDGTSCSTTRRGIEFKEIQIREYARTIGDNPSCSSGPPISISWEYDPETKIVSIDQYEKFRSPRRTHFEMVLPRTVRQDMLKREWDVTQAQIAAAVRANIKIKNQRRMTVNNLSKSPKMEEMLESASRGLKRGILLGKSTDKELAELERQFQEAEKARAMDLEAADFADLNSGEL